MRSATLTAEDWLNAGLKALAKSGVTSLKADVLARRLEVSRGSFYWHFVDVKGFHRGVLDAWEKRATADVIAEVEQAGGSARERLHRLARLVFAADGALERQVRSWACHSEVAAHAQNRIDLQRITYVQRLVDETDGGPASDASTRARFFYLALVGQFATGRRFALSESELASMVELVIG